MAEATGSVDGVVPYRPSWPQDFRQVADSIQPFLAGIPHRIEHVGSTSVPGLAAKPIIDLDIVVPDRSHVAPAIAALGEAGWIHEGNLGIEGREGFDMLPGLPRHHLYLVVDGTAPHRDHVDLRDYLRCHPAEAQRYASVKRELSPLLDTDRRLYTAGKDAVVEQMLQRARHAFLADGTATIRPITMDDAAVHLAGEDAELAE